MSEIIFTKRKAKEGEVGLFVDSDIWAEEWSCISHGAQVVAECSVPETAKYRKFFYALVGKCADNCDWMDGDKDFAKEQILFECHHVTYHTKGEKTEIRAKSTKNLSSDQWIRLIHRATYIVASKYLHGMKENDLKREIEKMIGG
jgi:hypothetical protein